MTILYAGFNASWHVRPFVSTVFCQLFSSNIHRRQWTPLEFRYVYSWPIFFLARIKEVQHYTHYVALPVRGGLRYILQGQTLLDLWWSPALMFISKSGFLIRSSGERPLFVLLSMQTTDCSSKVEYMAGCNAQAFAYNQTLWSISWVTCLFTPPKKKICFFFIWQWWIYLMAGLQALTPPQIWTATE